MRCAVLAARRWKYTIFGDTKKQPLSGQPEQGREKTKPDRKNAAQAQTRRQNLTKKRNPLAPRNGKSLIYFV